MAAPRHRPPASRRVLRAVLLAVLLPAPIASAAPPVPPGFVRIEATRLESVLPAAADSQQVQLAAFLLQRLPVTNGDFLAFVRTQPKWRRGEVATLFADAGYLKHWDGPQALGSAARDAPVVNVSWFAANAYCESRGARLPTWHEWEWAAAADETQLDARGDPAWRQRILNWYAETGGQPLRAVGQGKPNRHGVHDLHGLIWEWVQDYGAMMVSGDNREQGDPDLMKFCGTGALSMEQKEHYAVLMRIAMLSSLEARDSTANLGFRCARDLPGLRP